MWLLDRETIYYTYTTTIQTHDLHHTYTTTYTTNNTTANKNNNYKFHSVYSHLCYRDVLIFLSSCSRAGQSHPQTKKTLIPKTPVFPKKQRDQKDRVKGKRNSATRRFNCASIIMQRSFSPVLVPYRQKGPLTTFSPTCRASPWRPAPRSSWQSIPAKAAPCG